jgi:CSLREA domain-containing protein
MLILAAFFLAAARLIAPLVYAAPPLVTSPLDNAIANGVCTLREAIITANGGGGFPECAPGTNITFAAGVTEILINAPLPALTADGITINGGGNVILRGDRAGAAR